MRLNGISEIDGHAAAGARGRGEAWRWWVILWACVVLAEAGFLANDGYFDTLSWNATRWFVGDREDYSWAAYRGAHAGDLGAGAGHFYERLAPPLGSGIYRHTVRLWEVLKCFGEPWMVVIVALGVAVYHRKKWWAGGAAAGAIALAAGIGALVAAVDGRWRPTHIDGANHWEFLRGLSLHAKDLAHPSGHATAAFAMAAVLVYLSPRGRRLFVTVAAGCAVSRVVMGAHFWSDVILGAALGWTVGWWTMRAADRWLPGETSAAEGAGLEKAL